MECYVILIVLSSFIFMSAAAPLSKRKSFEDVGEYGDYFEGDMVLTAAQRLAVNEAMARNNKPRNGLIDASKRWANKTVVYHITEGDFDEEQIVKIKNALSDIENQTCIKFRKRREGEYAVIIQGMQKGCYSNVGFISKGNESKPHQVLNLARTCFKHGTVVHEMLHTLGFHHMQSTYDRDEFVKIAWENIRKGKEHNFAKYTNDTVTDFGVPYDYSSVMHYPKFAFSKNGMETIIPIQTNVTIGQRIGLSKSDVLKLNKMYDCPEVTDNDADVKLLRDATSTVTTDKVTLHEVDKFFAFLS